MAPLEPVLGLAVVRPVDEHRVHVQRHHEGEHHQRVQVGQLGRRRDAYAGDGPKPEHPEEQQGQAGQTGAAGQREQAQVDAPLLGVLMAARWLHGRVAAGSGSGGA